MSKNKWYNEKEIRLTKAIAINNLEIVKLLNRDDEIDVILEITISILEQMEEGETYDKKQAG